MSALGGKQTLASGDSQVLNPYGTPANLVDSSLMTPIIFRDLPAVAAVELQLDMRFRDRLLDDEIEELPHLIDDASVELFGITQRETFYWALPEPVRKRYGRIEWEENFDVLGHYTRDPNAHWRIFDLDLRCEKGSRLHCLEVFGRQLVCALQGLHPRAELTFAQTKTVQAA
jgi:hypothetical protein